MPYEHAEQEAHDLQEARPMATSKISVRRKGNFAQVLSKHDGGKKDDDDNHEQEKKLASTNLDHLALHCPFKM